MARKARLLAPEGVRGIYHVISRVVDRRMALADAGDKDNFVHWMYAYAEFCGVKILCYCIMDNHFHLLVDVRPFDPLALSDEELLRRLSHIAPDHKVNQYRDWLANFPRGKDPQNSHTHGDKLRSQITHRMGSLSFYMKGLKQRFTQAYNSRHKRKGTLWEERYRSVLVSGNTNEEAIQAVRTVAAYIDLNPVRAGLAEDPADYRHSSYGAAISGNTQRKKLAREGLQATQNIFAQDFQKPLPSWKQIHAQYRLLLYEKGSEQSSQATQGKASLSKEQLAQVRKSQGKLKPSASLSKRLHWMSQSLIIASQNFLKTNESQLKDYLSKRRKPTKLQNLRGTSQELYLL